MYRGLSIPWRFLRIGRESAAAPQPPRGSRARRRRGTPSAAAASASASVPTTLTTAARRRPRCEEQHRLDRHRAEGRVAAEQPGPDDRRDRRRAIARAEPDEQPERERPADVHDQDAEGKASRRPRMTAASTRYRSPAPTPPATAAASTSPDVHSADSGGSISPGHVGDAASDEQPDDRADEARRRRMPRPGPRASQSSVALATTVWTANAL